MKKLLSSIILGGVAATFMAGSGYAQCPAYDNSSGYYYDGQQYGYGYGYDGQNRYDGRYRYQYDNRDQSRQGYGYGSQYQYGDRDGQGYGSQYQYGDQDQNGQGYGSQYRYDDRNQNRQGYNSQYQYGDRSQNRQQQAGQLGQDQELRNEIQDYMSDYRNVNFTLNNGVVTLSGTVSSAEDKKSIEQDIRDMDGVKQVKNQLRVQEQSQRSQYQYRQNR